MTLAGRSIVVCRAERQAAPLLDRLSELGADVVHVPLIEIAAPADDGTELRRAIASVGPTDWVALTSANAVDAVADLLAGAAPTWRTAVVGEATARRAAAFSWRVDFVSPMSSAAGLGASLPVEAGERVVAPLAELASADLADALRHRGIEVETVTAYRSVTPAVSIADHQRIVDADVVLITAPSVIDRLVELLDPADLPALVAIGPTSAQAIEAAGLHVDGQAEAPSVDGLIDALVRTLQE